LGCFVAKLETQQVVRLRVVLQLAVQCSFSEKGRLFRLLLFAG
jgi:hypothetical protein